ncbi:DUF4262 domain-containing protein [Allokutzneria oryzae]|uniref:DUF4262 domain-containing protein n=1 Tax=Allokutzneria oryzae TaxID=1378989 RepID=A0ABV5ZPX4_9PSEU
MTQLEQSDEDLRRWLLETTEAHGTAVIQIEGEDHPPYAFSVGAWRRFGLPEVVAIGLPPEVSEVVINDYVSRASMGERFSPGGVYGGFLVDCPVTFERVAKPYYPQFFGSAFLLHPAGDFPALQMVARTPDGHWPWSADAPPGFAEYQPVLTDSGSPESWTPGVDGP